MTDHAHAPRGALAPPRRSLWRLIVRDHQLLIMCIPMVAFFFIFCYVPMSGIALAFVNYKPRLGIFSSPFAGLKYFRQVFNNPILLQLVRNTVLLGVYSLVFGFPVPILFALSVNEMRGRKLKRVVQTISYMPYFISTVVICGLLWNLLSTTTGVVNQVYTDLTGNQPIKFMTDPKYFRSLYVGSGIWQTFGWNSIIYLAALAGVDVELYDSAKVDGANRFRQLLHITFPSIMPVIIIMLVLNIGSMMSVGFEKIILMYGPPTYEVADVISTYTYRRGIISMEYSFGTAIGLLNALVNMLFIVSANAISRKFADTSLW